MLEIFENLVPEDFKTTQKLFIHYLKTLPDKLYKVKNSELSDYEIQIQKFNKVFTVVVHKNYKSEISKVSIPQIESLLKNKYENDLNTPELFLLDLRF
jgi:hypothetical protein